MTIKILLCAAAAVLAVAGNLGLIDEEKKGPVVLIHYIGLAVIFIYSYFHFDPKTALYVLISDMAASFISYKLFTRR